MSSVLDMSVVQELLDLTGDGDPELLLDLVQMFLEDSPERIKTIQQSTQSGDMEAMSQAAHSLKGSAGNLGLSVLQETCDQLQVLGHKKAADEVQALMPAMETQFSDALEALRELQAKYQP